MPPVLYCSVGLRLLSEFSYGLSLPFALGDLLSPFSAKHIPSVERVSLLWVMGFLRSALSIFLHTSESPCFLWVILIISIHKVELLCQRSLHRLDKKKVIIVSLTLDRRR